MRMCVRWTGCTDAEMHAWNITVSTSSIVVCDVHVQCMHKRTYIHVYKILRMFAYACTVDQENIVT